LTSRALPGTSSLLEEEKERSGRRGARPVFRDIVDPRIDRCIGLDVEPEAARQVRARHVGLALILPEELYVDVLGGMSWVLTGCVSARLRDCTLCKCGASIQIATRR
jgi:hypothetical protein